MHYQEEYDYVSLMAIVNELKRREGKPVELVTNSDAGTKCEDWTEKEPWVEASLWGYNFRPAPTKGDEAKDFRCHFCKVLVEEPKPYSPVCGTESCEAYWALVNLDRKKV